MASEMKPRTSITMEQYGNGWHWEVTYANGRTVECRTSREGDGMWNWTADHDWKQCRGLCQFRLPRERGAAYAKIRREAVEDADVYELLGGQS